MAKQKRRTALPRVTLMAYRRQDLVAFVQAVETLRLLVQDLRTVAEQLKQAAVKKPRRQKPGAGALAARERAEFDSAVSAAAPMFAEGGAS